MSERTPGGPGGAARPWEPVHGAGGDATPPGGPVPPPRDGGAPTPPQGRSRRRLWWLVALVVVVVAGVVTAVLLLSNGAPEPVVVPQTETVTLAPPSPTVEPVEPASSTPFLDALPRTVLAFALSGTTDDEDLVAAGALEAHRLTYTDGSVDLTVRAGQWPDAQGAAAAFASLTEEARAAADATATPSPAPSAGSAAPGVEQGDVRVDGEVAGSYVLRTRADGTGSVWWTNGTVLIELDGPADQVRDVYAAFPL